MITNILNYKLHVIAIANSNCDYNSNIHIVVYNL